MVKYKTGHQGRFFLVPMVVSLLLLWHVDIRTGPFLRLGSEVEGLRQGGVGVDGGGDVLDIRTYLQGQHRLCQHSTSITILRKSNINTSLESIWKIVQSQSTFSFHSIAVLCFCHCAVAFQHLITTNDFISRRKDRDFNGGLGTGGTIR